MRVEKKKAGDRRCPSCSEAMEQRAFDRKPLGRVELDVCFGCHALWFDQHESLQLTPAAVLQAVQVLERAVLADVEPRVARGQHEGRLHQRLP